MFNKFYNFLIFATLFANSFAEIPNFITRCKQTDPNISECLVKSSNEALPHLLSGNKELRVPKLNPLILPHVEQTSSNIKFSIDDVKIDGCQTLKMTSATSDFVKKIGAFELKGDKFIIDGTYDINGRILILPITGKGPIHIELENVVFKFGFEFDFVSKENKTYSKLLKSTFDWKAGKSFYKLDNLFNGDERLGKEMNKFLNENPDEVNQELGTPIAEGIKQIVDNIFKRITDYPLNELFG